MIKIVLLGAGNVAHHLYKAIQQHPTLDIIQCYNRKGIALDPGDAIAVTSQLHEILEADIYLLCISDTAITEVSQKLPFKNKLVVHIAGGVSMDAIASDQCAGVWYPLQTFSLGKKIDFSTVPICIEARSKKDLELLFQIASALSTKIYTLTSEQRSALHVAAVFVNNFTNHLYTIGNEICDAHQLPFEILYPLIQETAEKIVTLPPKQAQTGPAIRNDHKTITKHLQDLYQPMHQKLYTILTNTIQEYHGEKL